MQRDGDSQNLLAALLVIRDKVPDAGIAHFQSSDQGYVGFILSDLELRSGESLAEVDPDRLANVADDIWPLVSAIGWDGVMGEDKLGDSRLAL
ncbi:hypothetical protein [Actinoplanes sp. NPDC051851]|uniref:hypothetical protein n=1 Tax=Actinoplanes sp. NPDC051851 TaxID=3154753 RepID=UPI00341FAD06